MHEFEKQIIKIRNWLKKNSDYQVFAYVALSRKNYIHVFLFVCLFLVQTDISGAMCISVSLNYFESVHSIFKTSAYFKRNDLETSLVVMFSQGESERTWGLVGCNPSFLRINLMMACCYVHRVPHQKKKKKKHELLPLNFVGVVFRLHWVNYIYTLIGDAKLLMLLLKEYGETHILHIPGKWLPQ